VLEEKVLVIRRITVRYRLSVPQDHCEEVERMHGFHARFCPVPVRPSDPPEPSGS
jgi:hypothetical protein